MPPSPDRPRKPTGPARGIQPSPQPPQKPAPKPSSKPLPKPVPKLVPKATVSRPAAPTRPVDPPTRKSEPEREDAWALRLSPRVWWGIVLATGVLLIVCFEFGYSAGQRRAERVRSESQTEVAAAKPMEPPTQPPAEVKTPPKATPTKTPQKEPSPSAIVEPPKKSSPPTPPVTARPKEEPIKPIEPEKPTESTVALKFEKDILPIFQTKCISCHGGLSKKGGLDLRSLTSITRGGNSGPGLKPGQPDESQVWQSVKTGQMPPMNKPQLTADEKQLILKWIAGGGK
jgi:hypothetical protein